MKLALRKGKKYSTASVLWYILLGFIAGSLASTISNGIAANWLSREIEYFYIRDSLIFLGIAGFIGFVLVILFMTPKWEKKGDNNE